MHRTSSMHSRDKVSDLEFNFFSQRQKLDEILLSGKVLATKQLL